MLCTYHLLPKGKKETAELRLLLSDQKSSTRVACMDIVHITNENIDLNANGSRAPVMLKLQIVAQISCRG